MLHNKCSMIGSLSYFAFFYYQIINNHLCVYLIYRYQHIIHNLLTLYILMCPISFHTWPLLHTYTHTFVIKSCHLSTISQKVFYQCNQVQHFSLCGCYCNRLLSEPLIELIELAASMSSPFHQSILVLWTGPQGAFHFPDSTTVLSQKPNVGCSFLCSPEEQCLFPYGFSFHIILPECSYLLNGSTELL